MIVVHVLVGRSGSRSQDYCGCTCRSEKFSAVQDGLLLGNVRKIIALLPLSWQQRAVSCRALISMLVVVHVPHAGIGHLNADRDGNLARLLEGQVQGKAVAFLQRCL